MDPDEGGKTPREGCAKLLFGHLFSKTKWKLKKLDRRRRPHHPLQSATVMDDNDFCTQAFQFFRQYMLKFPKFLTYDNRFMLY